MNKLIFTRENSLKNIYDFLRVGFLYGDSKKELWCNDEGMKWLINRKN